MASAAEFRALAQVERDPHKRVRLPALANVSEGMTVEQAARRYTTGWRASVPAGRRPWATGRVQVGGASSMPRSGPRSRPGCWPARRSSGTASWPGAAAMCKRLSAALTSLVSRRW